MPVHPQVHAESPVFGAQEKILADSLHGVEVLSFECSDQAMLTGLNSLDELVTDLALQNPCDGMDGVTFGHESISPSRQEAEVTSEASVFEDACMRRGRGLLTIDHLNSETPSGTPGRSLV